MSLSSRPPLLSSRARGKRRTLAAVRDAAWALFCERGYEGATAREIAARAGIAAGTIFVHAKDKEELLVLVFQDRAELAFDRGIAVLSEEATVIERVTGSFAGLCEEYALRPALARRYLCATLTVGGAHGAAQARLEAKVLDHLVALIEDPRGAGALRADLDAASYARNLFALYRFTVLAWLAGPSSTTPRVGLEALREAFSLAHHGARPRRKKPPIAIASEVGRARRPARPPNR